METVIDQFILFSDHHSHPFTYGAEMVETPYGHLNSRLWNAHQVLLEMHTYAVKHDIKRAFFGGDLFHSRFSIPTEALFLMNEFFKRNTLDISMIPGNHDYGDRQGRIHGLDGFEPIVYDWASPRRQIVSTQIDGIRKQTFLYGLHFVPYTDDKARAQEALKKDFAKENMPFILLAHLGIQGAEVGSDYVLVQESDIGVSDIPWQGYAGCFFGHYHKHQQVFNNGWYIGATHAHNWGDVNQHRGFLHVQLVEEDGVYSTKFKFIETSAPRFIQVTLDELPKTQIKENDFVKVVTSKLLKEKDLEGLRDKYSKHLEPVLIPTEVEETAIELSEENLDPMNMVKSWVKANEDWLKEQQDISEEDLIAYGSDVLSRVIGAKS